MITLQRVIFKSDIEKVVRNIDMCSYYVIRSSVCIVLSFIFSELTRDLFIRYNSKEHKNKHRLKSDSNYIFTIMLSFSEKQIPNTILHDI